MFKNRGIRAEYLMRKLTLKEVVDDFRMNGSPLLNPKSFRMIEALEGVAALYLRWKKEFDDLPDTLIGNTQRAEAQILSLHVAELERLGIDILVEESKPKGMKLYKMRHKGTGMFFTPSKWHYPSLSETGRVYHKKPSFKYIGERYKHPGTVTDGLTGRVDNKPLWEWRPFIENEWEIVELTAEE